MDLYTQGRNSTSRCSKEIPADTRSFAANRALSRRGRTAVLVVSKRHVAACRDAGGLRLGIAECVAEGKEHPHDAIGPCHVECATAGWSSQRWTTAAKAATPAHLDDEPEQFWSQQK